jgi:hypothetical protein
VPATQGRGPRQLDRRHIRWGTLINHVLFGYATVNEQAIAEGVDILARVIGQL